MILKLDEVVETLEFSNYTIEFYYNPDTSEIFMLNIDFKLILILPSSTCLNNKLNALKYTINAEMILVIYSLYGVIYLSCIPFTSRSEIKLAENITPSGLLHASNATGIPLNPTAGSD